MVGCANLLLMAADKSSGPPPPSFYGSYNEVACIVGSQGSSANGGGVVLPGASGYFFTAYTDSGTNLYANMVTIDTGYNIAGTHLLGQSSVNAVPISGSSVSTTGFNVCFSYTPVLTAELYACYYTSSGATLTLTAGPSLLSSGSSNAATGGTGVCNLDSTHAIGFCYTSNYLNALFQMFNPTTLAKVGSSYTTYPSTSTSSNTPPLLVGLSSTLAAFFYIDITSNTDVYCAGIDRSGTSLTFNFGGTDCCTTGVGHSYAVSVLSSSTVLLTYSKSSTQIAARVITIASGGSVTVGSEATCTTGFTDSSGYYVHQGSALTSSLVINSFQTVSTMPNGSDQFVVACSISGTTVTFDTNIYTSNSGIENRSLYGTVLVPLSSTQSAMIYGAHANASTSSVNYNYASTLDYISALPTWGPTFVGNQVLGGNLAYGSGFAQSTGISSLGSNRVLVPFLEATGGYSTAGWQALQLDTASGNIVDSSSSNTVTLANSNYYANGSCRIYNDTVSSTRCLTWYYDVSNNVVFTTLAVDNSLGTTMGTPNHSFTNSNLSYNKPNSMMVSLAPDSTLYIQGSPSVGGFHELQASLITTSGTTVSTISTLTAVYTTTAGTYKVHPVAMKALSATQAVVVYTGDITGGADPAVYVGIIDVTSGTPTLTASAALTASGAFNTSDYCDAGFTTGSTGVLLYANSGLTDTIGVGFSYTTSSVTVSGSTSTLTTALPNVFGFGTVGVSGTEFITILGTDYYLVTLSSGINTVSIGTGYATNLQANYSFLTTGDNQNAVITTGLGGSGSSSVTGYVFRG